MLDEGGWVFMGGAVKDDAPGLTQLELFAGLAMAGYTAARVDWVYDKAKCAVNDAEALITELEKRRGKASPREKAEAEAELHKRVTEKLYEEKLEQHRAAKQREEALAHQIDVLCRAARECIREGLLRSLPSELSDKMKVLDGAVTDAEMVLGAESDAKQA